MVENILKVTNVISQVEHSTDPMQCIKAFEQLYISRFANNITKCYNNPSL